MRFAKHRRHVHHGWTIQRRFMLFSWLRLCACEPAELVFPRRTASNCLARHSGNETRNCCSSPPPRSLCESLKGWRTNEMAKIESVKVERTTLRARSKCIEERKWKERVWESKREESMTNWLARWRMNCENFNVAPWRTTAEQIKK